MMMPLTWSPWLVHTSRVHGFPDALLVQPLPLLSLNVACGLPFCPLQTAETSLPMGHETVTWLLEGLASTYVTDPRGPGAPFVFWLVVVRGVVVVGGGVQMRRHSNKRAPPRPLCLCQHKNMRIPIKTHTSRASSPI
jgi:hypothetical protein